MREAPCHTRTFMPSVCASISCFHCIIATVGLDVTTINRHNDTMQGDSRNDEVRPL